MNILEQEDLIKGLPDQALFQQAENPTGEVPQFLVISEIQRRNDMRKRFEASEPQPQTTAAERIVREGLGAFMPPQNSLPPPAMPAPPSTSVSHLEGSSPLMAQGMAAGGILSFAPGGRTYEDYSVDEYLRDIGLPRPTAEQRARFPDSNPYYGRDVLAGTLDFLGATGNKLAGFIGSEGEKRKLKEQRRAELAAQYPDLGYSEIDRLLEYEIRSQTMPPEEADNEEVIVSTETESLLPPSLTGDGTAFTNLPPEKTGTEATDENIPVMTGGAGDDVGITTDEMVYGNQLVTRTGDVETGTRTVDDIENFDPNSIKTKLPSPTDAYLNPELVAEVGETVTQGEALKDAQSTENEFLQKVLDSFESRRAGAEERLGRRRTESQDLINQIREEGKRDALSAALIQLGAGISSGDMSSGLREAGSAMTSANALARDAARAEQRSMRDYEESVLSQVDQLGMEEAQFAFGAERDAQARAEEIRQWEATHGLAQLNAKNDMIFKEAGLELQGAKLENDAYIGREGLKNQITKMNNDLKISTDTSRREAMRTFTAVLDSIQDFIDELPAGTSAEEMEEIRNTQQARILSALRTSLGEEFYDAFMRDYKPVRGDDTEVAIDYTEL